MVEKDELKDCLFTTSDLPINNPGGFEAYALLRDKISE